MNCLVITPLLLFLPHISEIHTSFAERMAANGIAQLLFPNIIAAEFAQIPFLFLNGFTIHNVLEFPHPCQCPLAHGYASSQVGGSHWPMIT